MSKGKLKKHPYLPKKASGQAAQPFDPSVAGIGWYTPESYARLLQVSVDRAERHPTYEEWLDEASDALINLQIMGVPFQKVLVDIDGFVKWCRKEGRTVDREACSTYVTVLLSSGKAKIVA